MGSARTRNALIVLLLVAGCGHTEPPRTVSDDAAAGDARGRRDAASEREAATERDAATDGDATIERDVASDADANRGDVMANIADATVPSLATVGPTYVNGTLAVDDVNVYWAALGQTPGQNVIMKVPRAGGAAVTLAQASVASMVADGSNVYWGYGTEGVGGGPVAIEQVPTTGGAVVTLETPQAFGCITQDQDNVYWTQLGQHGDVDVVRYAKAGGAMTTLNTNVALDSLAKSIAVDDSNVYFIDGYQTAMRVSKQGGTAVTLLNNPTTGFAGCRSLAVVGDSLLLAEQDRVVSLPATGTGGSSPTLVALEPVGDTFEADSAHLFWWGALGLGGSALVVDEASLDGGAVRTLAMPVATGISDLVVSSDGVPYWTTNSDVEWVTP
jgi:hypothetical protein